MADRALAFEQAYLVSRGVRPMALVGSCSVTIDEMARARGELLVEGQTFDVEPFVIERLDGRADYGYAAAPWVVDLYRFALRGSISAHQRDRITGLLLGYGVAQIGKFDERARVNGAGNEAIDG